MGYDAHSNTIISSHRGSANVMNWLEDFDFIKVDYTVAGCNDCHVHQGFNAAYNSVKDGMNAYLPILVAMHPGA